VTEVIRTACPRDCWDTCTLLVEVTDGRVTGVRGDPENQVTRGYACPKAGYELERLYSPQRLLSPLIKKDGTWKEAAWEEALDLVADKLQHYRSEFGPLSVMHYSDVGSMGWLHDLDKRFFNLFGGVTLPEGSLCAQAGSTAQALDFGAVIAHEPSDLVNAKTILIWGRNPAHTNIHLIPFLKEARENGAYVVLIDPVPTRTVRLCDQHIAPRPGTDGALALGMARVIVEEGLEDKDFIENHVTGFPEFSHLLKDYPLSRVAGITGIPVGTIRQLALRYASHKPSTILLGYGVQRYENGAETVRTIDALAALTGNIGVPGGGASYAFHCTRHLRPDISAEDQRKHHRSFPKPAVARYILRASDPPVKALFVTRANPVAQLPDTHAVRRAMESIEFKVVIDLVLTETAEMADVVLPCTTFFEQENVFSAWGHNYIIYGARAIPPLGQTKDDWEIFGELARRLGFGADYGTADQWLDTLLQPFLPEGAKREDLRGKSFRCPGAPYVPWADRKFKTPSGKYELYSERAVKMGTDPLPVYREPAEGFQAAAGLSQQVPNRVKPGTTNRTPPAGPGGKYSFHLLTPAHFRTIHSQYYEKVEPGTLPLVHLATSAAAKRGIQEGSLVQVVSVRGSLTGQARLHDDFRDDVVFIYHGGSARDSKGVNVLTPDRVTNIGSCATYYDCMCDVRLHGEAPESHVGLPPTGE